MQLDYKVLVRIPASPETDELQNLLEKMEKDRSWQPIDTAPKDGTEILLLETHYGGDMEMHHAKWGGDFHNAWIPSQGIGFFDDATHWMPLPALPNS